MSLTNVCCSAPLKAENEIATRAHGMRTIGLLNAYSTRNLGDAAIMSAIARMSRAVTVESVVTEPDPIVLPGISLVPSLRSCSGYVSVGGDIFNNARPAFVTRNFLRQVQDLARHRHQAIVFGQTIPSSCRGMALAGLAAVLRQTCAVVVRDRASYALLRAKGVDASLSWDAAFVLAPSVEARSAAVDLAAKSGCDLSRTVVLSLRTFDSMYPQDQAALVTKLADLARKLIDRGHHVAVLIQSAVGDNDSDRVMAAQLLELEPRTAEIDAFTPAPGISPPELLGGILASARVVVAVRYHAAVLALAGGRTPYHLYYSRKGADLSERLSLPGTALEKFDVESAIPQIEGTMDITFDPTPVAHHVETAFSSALARLP